MRYGVQGAGVQHAMTTPQRRQRDSSSDSIGGFVLLLRVLLSCLLTSHPVLRQQQSVVLLVEALGRSSTNTAGGTTRSGIGGADVLRILTSSLGEDERNNKHGDGIGCETSAEGCSFAKRGVRLDRIDSGSGTALLLRDIWRNGPRALGGLLPRDGRRGESEGNDSRAASYRRGGGGDNDYSDELETLLSSAFRLTVDSMSLHGYETRLDRYDLFHGHLFAAAARDSSNRAVAAASGSFDGVGGGDERKTNAHRSSRGEDSPSNIDGDEGLIGILFHCYEYPGVTPPMDDGNSSAPLLPSSSKDPKARRSTILEGVDLGPHRLESNCYPTLDEWRFRNVLWTAWWNRNDEGGGNKKSPSFSAPSSSSSSGAAVSGSFPTSISPSTASSSCTTHQGIWLLDGKSEIVANLRVDGTDFGPDCPSTVWEGYLGKHVGDIYFDVGCRSDGDGIASARAAAKGRPRSIHCAHLSSTW